ncbi:MAG TPA: dihydrolipoyllysine-residue succinyltransferase [bacterium]|jgi:2-oxoglutarate dehydrogenase E2 component (dihydrolipoamide succinyltransferase)
MIVEVHIPSPGESVNEVTLSSWLKKSGDIVRRDEELFEVESEKATLSVAASDAGKLEILVPEGETVKVGAVAAKIDTSVAAPAGGAEPPKPQSGSAPTPKQAESGRKSSAPTPVAAAAAPKPAPKREAASPPVATGNGSPPPPVEHEPVIVEGERGIRRQKLSALRLKVAERLVAAKNQTAMLTTFNEVDMSAIMAARAKYKEQFQKEYNVSLGFMSFFVKAVCEALKDSPPINAMIEGEEIVYHDYVDMGIAVSAPRGLVVPVIRNAQSLTSAQIEAEIARLADRARRNQLTLDEMTGGTFTISNGGVFGSLLSTPILNPPQSGILGMHNIVKRPVVVDDQIVIRPMMYLAFSYDHRIIDGRESVTFLVRVKQLLEDPMRLLLEV